MLKRAHWFGAAAVALLASVVVANWGCQGTCATNADCSDDTYCSISVGVCLTPQPIGFCKALPDTCTDVAVPVCGCDGKQYANQCEAALSRASVAATGACAAPCG